MQVAEKERRIYFQAAKGRREPPLMPPLALSGWGIMVLNTFDHPRAKVHFYATNGTPFADLTPPWTFVSGIDAGSRKEKRGENGIVSS